MIYLTSRQNNSFLFTFSIPFLAIFFTLIIGVVIFNILGFDPYESLYHFFVSPLTKPYKIAALIVKACPLIIIASGLVFCYRANIWNIGAEGQIIFGAIFSGWLALTFIESNSFLLFPGMVVISMLGGLFWGLIPAFLKIRYNTNEILVSLMLTYVASLFLDWLVRGPWRDPQSFGFPLTQTFSDGALISRMPVPFIGYIGQLHYGVLFALIIPFVCWFILMRMMPGYQVRVSGLSPRASSFAGFNNKIIVLFVFSFSGALAGLAGMIEVSANIGQLQPVISFGYGFTAIIVAFLARLNPLAVIPAGLIIALAELGGDSAQIAMGMPKVVTGIFKGILLFSLLAGETLNKYKINFDVERIFR